jgi:teichuronic acid biosynthesis glycosyltransferase TuaC
MASVAIIGPDGAGKTTITRMLQGSSSLRLKYIYMGINTEASNYALPMSRFAEYIRRRDQNRNYDKSTAAGKAFQHRENENISLGAKLWAAGRLANYFAEEWYRQLLSWGYQTRGYIALYDRHFLFDFSLDGVDPDPPSFDRRLHRWFLSRFYPRPDLVIYLDAPAEVLFLRKREKSIEELERRRQAFIRQGMQVRNFVRVDATQSLDKVYAEVNKHITQFSASWAMTGRQTSLKCGEGSPVRECGNVASTLETRPLGIGAAPLRAGDHAIRVLAIIPQPSSKGSFIFVERQIASLENAGVVCQSFMLASRSSPRALLVAWHQLPKAIRSFQPHLVHAHYGTMTAFLTILSTTLPVIITYRGSDLNPNRDQGWLRRAMGLLLSQIAALRAARIICVSNHLKDRLWWRRGRVSVIPSGVDTTIFYPRCRNEVRAELGWGRDERVVLFNAAPPLSKRLDLARSAVEVAQSLCGAIRFVVLDGTIPPDLIPILMNAADCLLLTSDWEGSPNVVKEALACNLPVISVDVGDVRERLLGVQPSLIVSRDAQEIGKGLAGVLKQSQRSNGRQLISHLSSEAIASRIVSAYRTALGSLPGEVHWLKHGGRNGKARLAGARPPVDGERREPRWSAGQN